MPKHWQTFAIMAAGIFVVITFDTTIAGFINPILNPLGLSYE